MKYGLLRPEFLISLKGVTVAPPALEEDGTLYLDAVMTLADVVRSPLISERASLLAESALNVASNQVRHMATLGGNLCLETRCLYYNQSHTFQFVASCFKRGGNRCYLLPKGKKCQAVFMADTVPALMCLDGKVEYGPVEAHDRCRYPDLYTGDPLSPLTLSEGDGRKPLKRMIVLQVNDETCEVPVEPQTTLLQVLRDQLDLTGTKE